MGELLRIQRGDDEEPHHRHVPHHFFFLQNAETVQTSTYTGNTGLASSLGALTAGFADWVVTNGPLSAALLGDRLQIPFVGSAVVMAYRVSTLPAGAQLVHPHRRLVAGDDDDDGVGQVLDGPTLAAIWVGNITTWDDGAIANLNPSLSLPSAAIRLTFSTAETDVTQLLIDGLSTLSSEFATTIQQAGGELGSVPGLAGAVESSDAAARLAYIQVYRTPQPCTWARRA